MTPWPPLTNETILLVSGLGRCGTSLMMQMLHAGGCPVAGRWPGFEEDIMKGLPFNAEAWARWARGKAVKAIDPHRWQPPRGEDYRIIWLDRDPEEQARSQLKFAGGSPSRPNRIRMKRQLGQDRKSALQHLLSIDSAGILGVRFEDLIRRPVAVVREIEAKLGRELNREAMAARVWDRSPRCFDGFLENILLNCGRPS